MSQNKKSTVASNATTQKTKTLSTQVVYIAAIIKEPVKQSRKADQFPSPLVLILENFNRSLRYAMYSLYTNTNTVYTWEMLGG